MNTPHAAGISSLIAMALTAAALGQSPTIIEPGWRLVAAIDTLANTGSPDVCSWPRGAHFNGRDGAIYVASRPGGAGGIYRFGGPGFATRTLILRVSEPASVVTDPIRGDAYYSLDYPGRIVRIPFGTMTGSTWVGDFNPSADDDPIGMAIAPNDYAGPPVIQPGEAVVVDEGYNNAPAVWTWSTTAPNVVNRIGGSGLVQPLDVAVGRNGVYVVDQNLGGSNASSVYSMETGGRAVPVPTIGPLPPGVAGIAIDPYDQTLLLRSPDLVLRLDPVTGVVTTVLSVPFVPETGSVAGIDVSPDGNLLVFTYKSPNRIFVLERGYSLYGVGCPGSNGVPSIGSPTNPPRLGMTFAITASSLPQNTVAIGILGATTAMLSLAPFGMPACQLLASPDTSVFLSDRPTPSTVAWSLTIPNRAHLIGVAFHQQVFAADPGTNTLGAIVSNRGDGIIGR